VTLVLWIAVLLLLVALVVLQLIGLRALSAWGVRPSRAVVALRAFNVLMVIGIVVLAFWRWMS